ncbi:hypothetical protein AYI68_g3821 [Smittium mucronatum]|uniref:Uncharacterized protein n=1 Tax=Smittium mucronatum TaxID=133383 RepID=A0A1R0GYS7_9FUNG|nr:hypothetical protein AYI68_g3821 [Smittium mucronatum]
MPVEIKISKDTPSYSTWEKLANSKADLKIVLEAGVVDDQDIVTVYGTRHKSLGTITKLPIRIADHSFPADMLVLKLSKTVIILETDWFNKFNAVFILE